MRGRRILSLLLAAALLSLGGCKEKEQEELDAAYLYYGAENADNAAYSQLEQSLAANMTVKRIDVSKRIPKLEKYDILYPDASVKSSDKIKDKIVSYVENGGYLFLTNDFAGYFDADFFGAKEFVKINSVPKDISFPEVTGDLNGIQELIADFAEIYSYYKDFDVMSQKDYGYGFVTEGAQSIADFQGVSIYGVNKYGEGTLLYTNPLLPNEYCINNYAMKRENEDQTHFVPSTATANQLIRSRFAEYVSKKKFGYSAERILGSFTSPDLAWQLHLEEITGFENKSAILFSELCKEYNAVPSYTLVRNTYKWFARYESVTYLLQQPDGFHIDVRENAYSSGTHVAEEDSFLSLGETDNAGSYFADYPEYTQRAYPAVGDFNADGVADIIAGCADGNFYYYRGKSAADGEWRVEKRKELCDTSSAPLSVGGYSSPAVYDLDGDGFDDIISGSADGDVYFFKGGESLAFEIGEVIISGGVINMTMPSVSDINGDGRAEIILGSLAGCLSVYAGSLTEGFVCVGNIAAESEGFLAPFVFDYNADGLPDIMCGTFDGYIERMKNTGAGNFVSDGFCDCDEMNYKGNYHLKFGNNCVPRFYDIDNDGDADLIAGELEYGLAIPIDSPYFAYREQLQEEIDYIKENHFYLGLHFYTNAYASEKREAEELALHKKAFDSYGIDYSNVGANQHTFRLSDNSYTQSYMSLWNSGFLWNTGAQLPRSAAEPHASSESVLAAPFFMDFKNKGMMITNTSVLGYYQFDFMADVSAKYDLPVSQYYHCDFTYLDDTPQREMIETLVGYKNRHSYNFVKEDQMMKSAAAAYNTRLSAVRGPNGNITLSAEPREKGFRLYDENYQSCVGVKIEFAEGTDLSAVGIEADVWRYSPEKNALYAALNGKAEISFGGEGAKITDGAAHIVGVNVPADVSVGGNEAKISFKEDGMMQVSVLGDVTSCTDGWKTEKQDGVTVITKFGEKSLLEFTVR